MKTLGIETSCDETAIAIYDSKEGIVGESIYNNMDDNNKKAMDVWQAGGVDAAIKHMMTGNDGKPRSYAEMRELYG